MGKPESTYKKKEAAKSPVSMILVGRFIPLPFGLFLLHLPDPSRHHYGMTQLTILGVLIFVVIVPLLLEPMKLLPQAWEFIMSILASVGLVSKA